MSRALFAAGLFLAIVPPVVGAFAARDIGRREGAEQCKASYDRAWEDMKELGTCEWAEAVSALSDCSE